MGELRALSSGLTMIQADFKAVSTVKVFIFQENITFNTVWVIIDM